MPATDPSRNELLKYSALWKSLLNFASIETGGLPFGFDERLRVSEILGEKLVKATSTLIGRLDFSSFEEQFELDEAKGIAGLFVLKNFFIIYVVYCRWSIR